MKKSKLFALVVLLLGLIMSISFGCGYVYEDDTFRIEFMNGSEVVLSKDYPKEASVEFPKETPVKESDETYDYVFLGWNYTGKEEDGLISVHIVGNDAVKIYAVYKRELRNQGGDTYLVTFRDSITGNLIGEPQHVPHGGDAVVPECPDHSDIHRSFKEWSMSAENITARTEIVAIYEPTTYPVVMHYLGETKSGSATYESELRLQPLDNLGDNFKFIDWYWNDTFTNVVTEGEIVGDKMLTKDENGKWQIHVWAKCELNSDRWAPAVSSDFVYGGDNDKVEITNLPSREDGFDYTFKWYKATYDGAGNMASKELCAEGDIFNLREATAGATAYVVDVDISYSYDGKALAFSAEKPFTVNAIQKAPLEVSFAFAEEAKTSLVYGETAPVPVATFSGFQYDDDESLATLVHEYKNLTLEKNYDVKKLYAGEYSISSRVEEMKNYDVTVTSGPLALSVARKALKVDSLSVTNYIYGAEAGFDPVLTISGFAYGESQADLGTPKFTVDGRPTEIGAFLNAKSGYSAQVTEIPTDNYSVELPKTATPFTVNPRRYTVTTTARDCTYGEDPSKNFQYQLNNVLEKDLSQFEVTYHVTKGGGDYNGRFVAGKDYAVKAEFASNSNYIVEETKAATFTVNKAPLMLGITLGNTFTYGDRVEPFITYEGFVYGDTQANVFTQQPSAPWEYSYSYNGGAFSSTNSVHDVGDYQVAIAKGFVSANYEPVYPNAKSFTIGKKDLTLNIRLRKTTITYGEKFEPVYDTGIVNGISYDGFITGENEISVFGSALNIAYQDKAGNIVSVSELFHQGNYTATVKFDFPKNYKVIVTSVPLMVNPKGVTITVSGNTSFTYGTVPSFAVNYEGFVNGEQAKYVQTAFLKTTADQEIAGSKLPVGSYSATVGGIENPYGDYTFTYKNRPFSVGKKELAVSLSLDKDGNYIYGTNPVFSVNFNGFAYEEDENVLAGGATYSYKLGEAVYTLEQYFDAGSYSVAVAGFSSENYELKYKGTKFTVDAKTASITVSATDATYGEKPQYSYAFDGFVATEHEAKTNPVYMFTRNNEAFTVTESTVFTAATYTVTVGYTQNPNYNITVNSVLFAINKKNVDVTIKLGSSFTYGDPVVPTVAYSGFVYGENVATAKVAVPESLWSYSAENGDTMSEAKYVVGKYYVKLAQGFEADNYTFTVQEKADFAVTPKQITLDVQGVQDYTYGNNPQGYGVALAEGYALGYTDTLADFTKTYSISGALNDYKLYAVGSYTLTATVINPNYTVTVAPVSFNVMKANLIIDAKINSSATYGDNFAPEYTYTGRVAGEAINPKFTVQPTEAAPQMRAFGLRAAEILGAGNYNWKLSGIDGYFFENYDITVTITDKTTNQTLETFEHIETTSEISVPVTVAKRNITVTLKQTNEAKEQYTYGEMPTFELAYEGEFVSKEDETNFKFAITGYNMNGRRHIDVGEHTVGISYIQNNNYEITSGDEVTFKVIQRNITAKVELNTKTVTYGTNPVAKIIIAKGSFAAGEDIAFSLTGNTPTNTYFPVGKHTIGVTCAQSDITKNYAITYEGETFTVNKQVFTVKATAEQGRRAAAWSMSPSFEAGSEFTFHGTVQLNATDAAEYTSIGTTLSEQFSWPVKPEIMLGGEDVTANFEIHYDLSITLTNSIFNIQKPAELNPIYKGSAYDDYRIMVTTDEAGVVPTVVYTVNGTQISGTPSLTNAGRYTISYTVTAANYETVTGDYTVTIQKANYVVTGGNNQTYTYTGMLQGDKIAVSGVGSDVISSSAITYGDYQQTNANEAGYEVTWSVAESDNYNAASGTYKLIIKKAPLTITAENQTKTYGATNWKPATIEGMVNNEQIALEYKLGERTYQNIGEIANVKESGTYSLVLVAGEGVLDNYFYTEQSITLTINKAEYKITGNEPQTYTYNGALQGENKIQVAGVKEGDVIPACELTEYQQTNANEAGYEVTWSVAESDNYNAANGTYKLIINKATVDLAGEWNLPQNAVYGNGAFEATYTLASAQDLVESSYTVAGTNFSGANIAEANLGQYAGTYQTTAKFTLTDSANYKFKDSAELTVELTSGTWTIEKATVAINGDWSGHENLTYDATEKSVTVSGYSDLFNAPKYENNTATNAGTYNATATFTLKDSENYVISGEAAKSLSWTIEPRSIKLSIATNSVTYSAQAANIAGQTDALSGNTLKLQYRLKPQVAMLAAAESQEGWVDSIEKLNLVDVDKYEIECKAEGDSNYAVATETFTLTINKAQLTVTAPPNTTLTYKPEVQEVPQVLEASGFMGEDQTKWTGQATVEGEFKNAADYTANFSIPGEISKNYEIIYNGKLTTTETISYSVTIEKAKVTVSGTWSEVNLTYNAEAQSVTASGYSDLLDAPTYAGNTATDAGTYTATATFTLKDSANYEIEGDNTLTTPWTIAQKQLSVTLPNAQTKTYGETKTWNGVTLVGVCEGDTIDVAYTYKVTYVGGSTEKTDGVPLNEIQEGGNYIVSYVLSGEKLKNYAVPAVETFQINIAQATGTITGMPTENEFTYDGTPKTVDLTDVQSNYGTLEFTTTKGTINENKLTFTNVNDGNGVVITATLDGTRNYTGASVTITIKMNKLSVSKPTQGEVKSFTYDGTEHSFTLTFAEGVDRWITGATSITGKNAQAYTLNIELNDTANCMWEDGSTDPISFTWTIGKAQLTATATTIATATYNTAAPWTNGEQFVKLDGLCGEETATLNFVKGSENFNFANTINAGTYTFEYEIANEADLSQNYNITYVNGKTITLTINKAEVVKPTYDSDTTFTYNGTAQGYTFDQNMSAQVVLSGDQNATNAGNYQITVALKDSANYKWSDVTGNTESASYTIDWSIAKASLTVTAPEAQSKTYGETKTWTGVTFTGAGAELAQTELTVTYTKDGNTISLADIINVNEYTINYTITGVLDNYAITGAQSGSFIITINRALLTITVKEVPTGLIYGDGKARWQGVEVKGLDGDTFEISYQYTLTRPDGSVKKSAVLDEMLDAGEYAIWYGISGATLSNYDLTGLQTVTYENGQLFIVGDLAQSVAQADYKDAIPLLEIHYNAKEVIPTSTNDAAFIEKFLDFGVQYSILREQTFELTAANPQAVVTAQYVHSPNYHPVEVNITVERSLKKLIILSLDYVFEQDFVTSGYTLDTAAVNSRIKVTTIDENGKTEVSYYNNNFLDGALQISWLKTNFTVGSTYWVEASVTLSQNAASTDYELDEECNTIGFLFKYKSVNIGATSYTIEDALKNATSGDVIVSYDTSFAEVAVAEQAGYSEANGNYVVKSGVTLWVPMSADLLLNKKALNLSNDLYNEAFSNLGKDTRYSQLTLPSSISLSVVGKLVVNGVRCNVGNVTGHTVKTYGYAELQLLKDSKIILNSGSEFTCFGFAYGEGNIVAGGGSTVTEPFSLTGHKGGTISSQIYRTVFPINQYALANIVCRLTIQYNAIYKVQAAAAGYVGTFLEQKVDEAINFIASDNSGFLNISSGYIEKWVDESSGKIHFEFSGKGNFNNLKIDVIASMDTKGLQVPIPGNFDLHVLSGSDVTVSDEVAIKLLPGASLEVQQGAKLTISSGSSILAYGYYDTANKKYGNVALSNNLEKWQDGSLGTHTYPHGSMKTPYRKSPTLGYTATSVATVRIGGTVIVQDAGAFLVDIEGIGNEAKVQTATNIKTELTIKEDFSKTDNYVYFEATFHGRLLNNENSVYGDLQQGTIYTYNGEVWETSGTTQAEKGKVEYVFMNYGKGLLSGVTNPNATEIEGALKLADPSLANYYFVGWYADAACTQKISYASGNVTVYGLFDEFYHFTFNVKEISSASFGDLEIPVHELTEDSFEMYGQAIKLLKDPSYVFGGWYLDEAYTTPYSPKNINAESGATVTLYAKCLNRQYQVTIDIAEGIDATVAVVQNGTTNNYTANEEFFVNYGAEIKVTSASATGNVGSMQAVATVNGELLALNTLYQITTPRTVVSIALKQMYQITFHANGGVFDNGEITYAVQQERVENLNALIAQTKPTKVGYDFAGWFTAAEGGTEVTAIAEGAYGTELFAHWNAQTYILTLTIATGTTLTVTDSSGNTYVSGNPVPYNTELTVKAGIKSGYKNLAVSMDGKDGSVDITAQAKSANGYTFNMESNVKLATSASESGGGCFAAGTLITLADGTQKKVEDLTMGVDQILVFDHMTGQLTSTNAFFVLHRDVQYSETVKLYFSNGTMVHVFFGHGFFDMNTNQYEIISAANVAEYVGHMFYSQECVNGELVENTYQLISYEIEYVYAECYSIYAGVYVNHFVNGMLAVSDSLEGLYNVFELDENMTYDKEKMQADIDQYGLFTYEEWSDYCTEEEFYLCNVQYLKVALGKGLVTMDQIYHYFEDFLAMYH